MIAGISGAALIMAGAGITGVAMTVTCALAIADPFLTAQWRFKAVWAGLVVSVIGCVAMYAGLAVTALATIGWIATQ